MSFSEVEDDEDEDDLLFQHCRKDLQALRDACHSYGYDDDDDDDDDEADDGDGDAYPRSRGYEDADLLQQEAGSGMRPRSDLVDDNHGDDVDDDEFILRSVQKRLATTAMSTASFSSSSPSRRRSPKAVPAVSKEPLVSQSLEEEDDEAILRAVRQRFGSFNVPFISSGSLKKHAPKEKKKDCLARETERHLYRSTQSCMNDPESMSGKAVGMVENDVPTEETVPPLSMVKEDLVKADCKKKRHVLAHKKEAPLSLRHSTKEKAAAKAAAKMETHMHADVDCSILSVEKDEFNSHQNISLEAVTTSDVSTELCPTISGNCKEEHAVFTFPGQAEMFDYSLESFPYEPVDGVVLDNNNNITPIGFSAEQQGKGIRDTVEALKKNRLLQKVLTKKLQLIQSKLQENAQLKKQVRSLVEAQNITNRCASHTNITNKVSADCSFTGSKGRTSHTDARHAQCKPPPNSDVARLKAVFKDYSCDGVHKAWTKVEKAELLKGLKQQIQESRIRTAMDNFNAELEDMTILDDQIKAITEQELTAHDIRAALPLVNWEEVARLYVVNRSPIECWIQWVNYEDPLIKHGPWTKAEDKRLWSVARNNKLSNWEKIAQQLGGHRSVAQCLIRYQRSLNAGIVRSTWTAEEDKQLRAAVQIYGDKDWQAVASTLDCRTSTQCWDRWNKTLHPARKKSGKWDAVEDRRLKIAVSICGPQNWKMIATHVPGRTGVQCRERWCNVLDPSLSYEGWTKEEDEKLNQAVIRHGFRWSIVSNDLKPRTDNQCWRRWKCLHPDDVLEMQKNNKIQKIALLNNFVGRKKERPALEPSDFIAQGTRNNEDHQTKVKCRRPRSKCQEGGQAKVQHKRHRVMKPILQRNGTTAFMRFVREVARVSRRENKQDIASQWDDINQVSSSTNDIQIIAERSDQDNIDFAEGKLVDEKGDSKGNESEPSANKSDNGNQRDDLNQDLSSTNDMQIIAERSDPHNVGGGNQKDVGNRTEESESSAKKSDRNATSCEMDKTQNSEEVEVAMRALFSWPLFWGLQDLWRRQEEEH